MQIETDLHSHQVDNFINILLLSSSSRVRLAIHSFVACLHDYAGEFVDPGDLSYFRDIGTSKSKGADSAEAEEVESKGADSAEAEDVESKGADSAEAEEVESQEGDESASAEAEKDPGTANDDFDYDDSDAAEPSGARASTKGALAADSAEPPVALAHGVLPLKSDLPGPSVAQAAADEEEKAARMGVRFRSVPAELPVAAAARFEARLSRGAEPPVALARGVLPPKINLRWPPLDQAAADDDQEQDEGLRTFYTARQEQAVMDWCASNPPKSHGFEWKRALYELAPFFPPRERRRPYKGNDLYHIMKRCKSYDAARLKYPHLPPQLWGNERAAAEEAGTYHAISPRKKK
jgi:hypothetical protein